MTLNFDILDPQQDLSHHYLIEASAGTGKTYSIENIILRLLIEGETPLPLSQIIAVTFTRAAVADMRLRVRENLRQSLQICKRQIKGKTTEGIPPFLTHLFQQSGEQVFKIKRKLEQALSEFDQAPIFTIHAFCARILRENLMEGSSAVHEDSGEKDLSSSGLEEIVKNILRTELRPDWLSPDQLQIALSYCSGFSGLVSKLSESITSLLSIEPVPSFGESFRAFTKGMQAIQSQLSISSSLLMEDFMALGPTYRDVCNRQKMIKPECLEAALRFSQLFDKEAWEEEDLNFLLSHKGVWNNILAIKKAAAPILTLHYPAFSQIYEREVGALAKQLGTPEYILSLLAERCQTYGQKILKEKEQLGFNSLLLAVQEACQNRDFVESVRSQFKAVIIDEFQDTDPLQWHIFNSLFPADDNSWGRLFLVGDPKQSIYSFRQADIYTYLSAGNSLGEKNKARLSYNFRSEPDLVAALNALFEEPFTSNFIQLPRLQACLPYAPVKAGGKVQNKNYHDARGSLHLHMISKEKYQAEEIDQEIFPFIAGEIQRLHLNESVKLADFAVLVADKFQAQRLISYFRQWNMPAAYQRGASLSESQAVQALRELLHAVCNPKDESALKTALGGPLLAWTHLEILALQDFSILQKTLEKLQELRQVLYAEGFGPFFLHFLQSVWENSKHSVEERLLSVEDPLPFYNECQQIADYLIENCPAIHNCPEQLIDALLHLEKSEEAGRVHVESDENTIRILTIHSSKGLEFPIVFALGLSKRTTKMPTWIPQVLADGKMQQKAAEKDSVEFLRYCEEVDAEKMRQLYVALTRAKHRLYVPLVFTKTSAAFGKASPIELFTARGGNKVDHYEDLYQKISQNSASAYADLLKSLPADLKISFSDSQDTQPALIRFANLKPKNLVQRQVTAIPGSPIYIKSYTSLAQSRQHQPGEISLPAPVDYHQETRSMHTLPAGSEMGILLHAILEGISFKDMRRASKPEDLVAVAAPYLNQITSKWCLTIAEIIFACIKTPLFPEVPPLAELPEEDCYRELEFVFPTSHYGYDGYLKGVIDVMFRYKGVFYLIDWKSNWLGPNGSFYDQDAMQRAMQENDYFLQARIYLEASERYRRLLGEGSLGSIAYVFMRGISSGTGVYTIKDY